MVEVVYCVVPSPRGWRVHSRGFAWEFGDRPDAVDFARRAAKDFAEGTGHSTSVRVQDGADSFRELDRYAGVTRLAGGLLPRPQRHGRGQLQP